MTNPAALAAPATRARSRNRRGEGSLLRAEILAAATALLDSGGGEQAVTLRAVARGAGISAPSIYPHFPDREALVRATMDQAFAELADQLRHAADRTGDAPRQRLYAICRACLAFAHDRPERYRAMFDGPAGPPVTTADPAEACGDAMRFLSATLADCVASGDSTSEDPTADAVTLWLALHGLVHQRAVAAAFSWPADLTGRIVVSLARLTDG